LAPVQVPLNDVFEPHSLEIVRLDTSLERGPFREQSLKHAPPTRTTPRYSPITTRVHGLPIGIPASVLGEGEEHGASDLGDKSSLCVRSRDRDQWRRLPQLVVCG
jgi:hypothetical protein